MLFFTINAPAATPPRPILAPLNHSPAPLPPSSFSAALLINLRWRAERIRASVLVSPPPSQPPSLLPPNASLILPPLSPAS